MKTETAVKFFKNKSALARALGIAQSSIYDWGKIVPFPRQQQIESLTNGKLKAMTWDQFIEARKS